MKSREHVTTNGRAAFYASMWEDLKNAAHDCGWALGLHGSLNSDMDIMAMPWKEGSAPAGEMIRKLCSCFTDEENLHNTLRRSVDNPNNRVVYTLSIWADFYLDINIIQPNADLPDDYEAITGFKTREELGAYERGRRDEETVIIAFIKAWTGSTNSELGQILKDKFKEMGEQ